MIEFSNLKLDEKARFLWELEKQEVNRTDWTLQNYKDEVENGKHFLWESEGLIEGFVLYRIVLDELWIMNLAVRHKGRGSGSMMMKEFFSLVSSLNIAAVILEVSAQNQTAVRLYEKLGFVLEARRPNYYQDKSEALVMLRKLDT